MPFFMSTILLWHGYFITNQDLTNINMKKLFVIALGLTTLSLAFQSEVKAQVATGDQIKFGFKAGANLMKVGELQFGEDAYGSDHKVGFQAGIYAELPLGSNFAFLPEATFIQKGGKVEATVDGTTGKLETDLNYLDVPLMIGYRATPDLTIFAGPQVSFLLSQKTTVHVNGEKLGEDNTDTDGLRKSLAGAAAGIGYRLGSNLNVNARYMMDFQDATKDDVDLGDLKNSGFALSLGYSF
jgi:outer membrane immunogenic protein